MHLNRSHKRFNLPHDTALTTAKCAWSLLGGKPPSLSQCKRRSGVIAVRCLSPDGGFGSLDSPLWHDREMNLFHDLHES